MQLELKAQFFAQYWGQQIFMYNGSNKRWVICGEFFRNDYKDESGYLDLRDLKDITDEDAIGLAKYMGETVEKDFLYWGKYYADQLNIKFMTNENLSIRSYQYLQSKGYALPYMNYSVENLIEMGFIKLIIK